ncbi:MAG: DUF488 family protein [Actinomycetota bacterium]|nr:DUF488 family protein [Actinomycetota bacterium]
MEIIRLYEDTGRLAGDFRVLVDRLWPRGLTRETVDYDQWVKELAPSTDLRRWYSHDPYRFEEFSRQYRSELDTLPKLSLIESLLEKVAFSRLVLLTATRDLEHSGAMVLKSVIREHSLFSHGLP